MIAGLLSLVPLFPCRSCPEVSLFVSDLSLCVLRYFLYRRIHHPPPPTPLRPSPLDSTRLTQEQRQGTGNAGRASSGPTRGRAEGRPGVPVEGIWAAEWTGGDVPEPLRPSGVDRAEAPAGVFSYSSLSPRTQASLFNSQ